MNFWLVSWFVIVMFGAAGAGLLTHELVHLFGGGGDREICFGYSEEYNTIARVHSAQPFKLWAGEGGAYTVQSLVTLLVAGIGGEIGRRFGEKNKGA